MSDIAELVERLCETAKNWGWTEDCGTRPPVIEASEKAYNDAKSALLEALSALQAKIDGNP